MNQLRLDTLTYSLGLYDRLTPSMGFKASTRAEAEAWQRELRSKLVQLLGGTPIVQGDLDVSVIEKREFPTYVRETLLFESRPGIDAFGYMLFPRDFTAPGPAIVCVPGHGRGVDDIVGIKEDGTLRSRIGGYQKDFALQSIRHGYAVLAIENIGFGHKRDKAARSRGAAHFSCEPLAGAAMLFGQTLIGWRVWEAIRSLDYLETRPEIDKERLVVMGVSSGGMTALYTAAQDERFRAAVVSGYLSTFRDSIVSNAECVDNYVPGLLNYAEMYDVAGLIAPRALFAELGTRDEIFPMEPTKFAVAQVRRIYSVMGADGMFGFEAFEGKHEFHGKGAFKFLGQRL